MGDDNRPPPLSLVPRPIARSVVHHDHLSLRERRARSRHDVADRGGGLKGGDDHSHPQL